MDNTKKPHIVKKSAMSVKLMPGKYYFCTCGKSNDQPFCDGQHEGTDFSPKRFKISEPGQHYMCLCKHSKNMPFCDGAHAKLPEDA